MKKILVICAALTLVFAGCPTGNDESTTNTILKIKNESFTEITDVIWQGVSFANSQYENSIQTGTNVSRNVDAGTGYIFFKRKTNPIVARTRDVVSVAAKENGEFTFTDNTVIVEVNNTGNIGTLGSLTSTVVFFDDAEGEMQQYFEKQSFVGYYNMSTVLSNGYSASSSSYNKISAVKSGNKSIAVGGTKTAKLHLRITLTKPAQLSFWVANKYAFNADTAFSINGTVNATWKTDTNWAFKTYTLTAGQNDLVWEKKDGYSLSPDSYPDYHYYYLSLDDILIYYTE